MNTNQFYKELFEKYAFDEEKIRKNAIKAAKTPAWQRTLGAHWKSVAGVAAAVAVTVGGVAAYNAVNPSIDVKPDEDLPTAYQRLEDVENNYYNPPAEAAEHLDIFVSFMDVMSYSDIKVALSAVSDSDEIDIECIYLSDGSKISGADAVESFARNNSSVKNISGAKLSAPAGCYNDIQDLTSVFIAEIASDKINDETFSPIHYDDSDPLTNDFDLIITTAQQPSVTTSPFSFAGETSSAVSEAAAVTEITDITTETTEPAPVSAEPDVTSVSDIDEDPENTEDDIFEDAPEITSGSSDTTTEVPEITTAATDEPAAQTSSEPAGEITVPVTEIPDAPQIGLMTQLYHLNVENATETLLVDDYAIVLTRNQVYFYKIGGFNLKPAKICEASNPKLAYYGYGKVILTGCGTSGLRDMIITLDIESDYVYCNDVSKTLGVTEIATINFSPEENKYYLKAITGSTTYFYELTLNPETGATFRPLVEFTGAVSAAGSKNGILWFTGAEDGVDYSLYSFDCTNGKLTKVENIGSVCKVRRSPTFASFIIMTADKSYVLDAFTGKLIPALIEPDSQIAEKDGAIYISYYGSTMKLNENGELVPTTVKVSFTEEMTSRYKVVSTDSEKVVIAEDDGQFWH